MSKIFISQKVLDKLFSDEKARLEGDLLTVHSKKDQVFKLSPAYKFLYVADGSEDKKGMVGKIFTDAELKKAGADIYMDSALVSDVAYQVEPGFVGEPQKTSSQDDEEESVDEQLLGEYLLKIL